MPAIVPPVVVLGVDVGSTNTKAVVVAVAGDDPVELAVRSTATPVAVPDLLASARAVIEDALRDAGAPVQAVGIASMAETGAPLDAAGAPLGPLRSWQGRTDPGDRLIAALAGAERFAATGVPATPKPAPVALARLRRDEPRVFARTHRWAGAADLVALALTGRLGTDHTLALRTGAYRLPPPGLALPGGYDPALLAPFGLPAALLPPVEPPGSLLGAVVEEAAGAGLPVGAPVTVAGHDHLVGAWAAGVRGPGRVADSLGTVEALIRFPAAPVDRAAAVGTGASVVRGVDGNAEGLLAAATGAGAAVGAWFDGPPPLGLLDAAAALLPDPGRLLVLPYPTGRQAPAPDPAARLRLVDLEGRAVDRTAVAPVDAARALLLGLALQARWLDDEQRRLTGLPAEPWTVLGGAGAGAAQLALRGAVAPAGIDVVEAREPVAAGAALLAGVRAGLLPDRVRLPVRTPPAAPALDADRLLAAFTAAARRPGSEGAP